MSVLAAVVGLALTAVGAGLHTRVDRAAIAEFVAADSTEIAREGGTTATFWASAVYGALVTALVSFVPGSGVAGGAVAAYLHEDGSALRVGATTGLVGWALTVPLLLSLAAGLFAGSAVVNALSGGVVLAGIVLVGELLALALNAGFGALGGFLADRVI